MTQSAAFGRPMQTEIQSDLVGLFRGAVQIALEICLNEAVRNLVGAGKYERLWSRKDTLNGTYLRRVLTSMGHIEAQMPRTRENGSPTEVLGRYSRRTDEIDRMITEAYVQGSSTRDVSRLARSLMGQGVSRSTVSRITKSLEERIEALRSEPISQEMPYLFLDATYVDARWARSVENVSALVAYGVGLDGHRHLLAVTIGSEESDESWGDLLSQLLDRGLTGVRLVVSDDHRGLAKAARRLLPGYGRNDFRSGTKLGDDWYETLPGLKVFFYDAESIRREIGVRAGEAHQAAAVASFSGRALNAAMSR